MTEKEGKNSSKLHAVCVAFPAQGHITPMLQLANILNSKGFYITFFHTDHNYRCLLKRNGPNSLDGTPTFRFATFSDGLPVSNSDLPRPLPALVPSLESNSLQPFVNALHKLNEPSSDWPPVSLIISDAIIPFAVDAANQLSDCAVVYFTPTSPSSFIASSQYDALLQRGTLPFKEADYMRNGCLEAEVEEPVPGSMKGMKLKHLPSHIRTQDKNHPVFSYMRRLIARCSMRPIIFNTFMALDHEVIKDLSAIMCGPIYTVGPLNALSCGSSDSNNTFWKEDLDCLKWLDSQNPNSVVYASFGSTTMMTTSQLVEFAWGLANTRRPFLWVIRPDTIIGQSEEEVSLPVEFQNEVRGRGLIVSWCPQQKVLSHPATAVFLTHCGWNSILETISCGVPVICWPYKGDHQPIGWWCCYKWGIGLELSIDVHRDQVENTIIQLLDTETGTELKRKAMDWKRLVGEATTSTGSSTLDVANFINYVLSLN